MFRNLAGNGRPRTVSNDIQLRPSRPEAGQNSMPAETQSSRLDWFSRLTLPAKLLTLNTAIPGSFRLGEHPIIHAIASLSAVPGGSPTSARPGKWRGDPGWRPGRARGRDDALAARLGHLHPQAGRHPGDAFGAAGKASPSSTSGWAGRWCEAALRWATPWRWAFARCATPPTSPWMG